MPEIYRIVLTEDEVILLDEYFTHRVGWIGHELPSDLAANSLADIIAQKAEEIRKREDNRNR